MSFLNYIKIALLLQKLGGSFVGLRGKLMPINYSFLHQDVQLKEYSKLYFKHPAVIKDHHRLDSPGTSGFKEKKSRIT